MSHSQARFVKHQAGRFSTGHTLTGNVQKLKVIDATSGNETLTVDDSGKTLVFNHATARTVTLPSAASAGNGWKIRAFVAVAPGSGTHTIQEDTATDTNVLKGSGSSSDSGANLDADSSTGFTNVNFTTTAVASDYVDITCDGTNFHVYTHASINTGVTLT